MFLGSIERDQWNEMGLFVTLLNQLWFIKIPASIFKRLEKNYKKIAEVNDLYQHNGD